MPEINKSGTPATLEFDAVTYDPPLRLEKITEADWDLSSPEGASAGFMTASSAGKLDWMVRAWVQAEQGQFKAEYSKDPKKLERETAMYQRMVSSEITTVNMYGDYRVLAVRNKFENGSWLSLPSVYKKDKTVWVRTNDLSRDRIFGVILGHILSDHKESGK